MQNRKISITKNNVVIGWLGVELDEPGSGGNSKKWRPSISLVQHRDFIVTQFEMLYQPEHFKRAERVKADIKLASPSTKVILHEIKLKDPRNFPDVFEALQSFSEEYKFEVEKKNYFVHLTTGTHVAQICMFLLTEAHVIPGSLIQTAPPKGKHDLAKYEILDIGDPQFLRIRSRTRSLQVKHQEDSYLKDGIETPNPAFNDLINEVTRVAIKSSKPILLLGPSGAGKSKLAQRIYELKQDKKLITGKFEPVNCATIRGDGAMSALFGHKKGSFTGAFEKRAGHLKMADKGVLFLDEIGELRLEEQAMLLRALDVQSFLPFGSDEEVSSNFQLIAGTNKDLKSLAQKGEFREDLLARIDHWRFVLPGLRDRVEDIEPNIQFELNKYNKEHKTSIQFTSSGLRKFLTFSTSPEAIWKRNFRDLERAIDRMAVLAPYGRITEEDVCCEIEKLRDDWKEAEVLAQVKLLEKLIGQEKLCKLDLFSKVQLDEVVKVCLQCRTLADASRILFAYSSSQKESSNDSDRLRKYLKKFGIEWKQLETLK